MATRTSALMTLILSLLASLTVNASSANAVSPENHNRFYDPTLGKE